MLSPFKSAKRCYCLGEYLAAIELCAHVGEMLAQLLWAMSPITHNQEPVTTDFEKAMWGSTFEKLGQDRRVKVLEAFTALKTDHVEIFNFLRTTRRKYFHLWSESTEDIQEDAKNCFIRLTKLVKEILQMDISPTEPGKITVNPMLSAYLERTKKDHANG